MTTGEPKWLALPTGIMLRLADKVIVLGSTEKEWLIGKFPVVHQNIQALPNAITPAPDRFIRPTAPVKADRLRMVFLGRIDEEKGILDIMRAFEDDAELRDRYSITLYGDGTLLNWVREAGPRILGENFRYGGVLSPRDKYEALSKFDVFLLPSRRGEGLPMAMLEAMSCGLVPCVSSMASIPEVIEDGRNGYLIVPDNIESLRAKLNEIWVHRDRINEISDKAVKTVVRDYSIENYALEIIRIYRSLTT